MSIAEKNNLWLGVFRLSPASQMLYINVSQKIYYIIKYKYIISLDTSYQEPALLLGFRRYAGGQRVAAGHHYHSVAFLTSAPHVTIRQFRVICPVVLRRTASDYKYL